MQNVEQLFSAIGGVFIAPVEEIRLRLSGIKAFVFDWDGVFNNGIKGINATSNFCEPDAMGTNLLRLGYWLHNKKTFPLTAIITGMDNQTARMFAEREQFHDIYLGYKNKAQALDDFVKKHAISYEQIAYVFDDILDIPVIQKSGLSFKINRPQAPLFHQYILENKLCHYVTSGNGNNFAVREVCELILGLRGEYQKALDERVTFSGLYTEYLNERKKIQTHLNQSNQ